MPRPCKCRHVCSNPKADYFKPKGMPVSFLQEVGLTVDEFEAIRLADLEGLYQEDAARKMNISRQTFGNIIESAHRKVADAIVNGKALRIEGGIIKMIRICIPTESKEGLSATASGHFGSSPYFTIYDTEKGSVEIIENTNQHHSHGMCTPLGALSGKNIDAVVCGGMGARAVQKLNEAGIKAYRVTPGTVQEIIDSLKKGGLEEITIQNACMQHNCHQ